MVANEVALKELKEEVADMLSTCFVGAVSDRGEHIELKLCNGQKFRVCVEELPVRCPLDAQTAV